MTRTPLLAAAAAAAASVGGVALAATGGRNEQKARAAPPRIYGAAPAPASPTRAPRPAVDVAEDIARRWTNAWDQLTVCKDSAKELRTVVSLSTGKLAQQIDEQPPRPAFNAKCNPQKLVALRGFLMENGSTVKVLVEREGETGGPLTLTLMPTDRGLRVVQIDY